MPVRHNSFSRNDLSDRSVIIGNAIRAARRAANLSQEELGEAVGVHRPTVSSWETGKHEPTAANLGDIARALGMTVAALEALAQEIAGTKQGARVRESSRGYTAFSPPTVTPRIPPRAYNLIYDYCTRLEEAGVPEAQIEEARRLMSGTTFNTLNKYTSDPRDEAGWIKDIRAAWAFIRDVLTKQGFDL